MWCSALLVADWGDYCCAEHAVLGSAIQCFKPALLPLVCLVWGQLSHQPAGTEVVVFKLVLPEPLSLTLSSLLFPFSLETHSCCGSLDLIVCLFFDSHNYFSFASFVIKTHCVFSSVTKIVAFISVPGEASQVEPCLGDYRLREAWLAPPLVWLKFLTCNNQNTINHHPLIIFVVRIGFLGLLHTNY